MTRVNETVIQDVNLRRGLRVPGMALLGCRPLVQARPAPPSLSAMSVILPYIAPLLLLLETNTEAKGVVAGARGRSRARLAERRAVPSKFQEPPR